MNTETDIISSTSNIDAFSPWRLRGLEMKNRFIKAATFEGHCPNGRPDKQGLGDFHEAFAKGGVGLCTVSYGSVEPGGRTFDDQMCLQDDILDDLKEVTDRIHAHGAKASIQLAHCGITSKWSGFRGSRSRAVSSGVNTLGLFAGIPFGRAMKKDELTQLADNYRTSAARAIQAGFDAVELHMGHGYLLSQFLSPSTNKRKDEYGGSVENRTRFPIEVVKAVRAGVGEEVPIIVKMNVRDGFAGGLELDDSVEVAKMLEANGVDALVLSGGFASKNSMFLFRGPTFVDALIKVQKRWIDKLVYTMAKPILKSVPFEELYFYDDTEKIREATNLPLISIGGVKSMASVQKSLEHGFDAVALGRALIHDPALVNEFSEGLKESGCNSCNLCVAEMDRDGVCCVLNDNLSVNKK